MLNNKLANINAEDNLSNIFEILNSKFTAIRYLYSIPIFTEK